MELISSTTKTRISHSCVSRVQVTVIKVATLNVINDVTKCVVCCKVYVGNLSDSVFLEGRSEKIAMFSPKLFVLGVEVLSRQ